MSKEAMTGLMEAIKNDGDLRKEFLAATSFDQAAAIAVRKGWVVTAGELEAIAGLPTPAGGELSEAELEQVAGGKIMERYDQSAKNVIQSMRG